MRTDRPARLLFLGVLLACNTDNSESMPRTTLLLTERVQFDPPATWRILGEDSSDSLRSVVFHVPNPVTDSATTDRTNIILTARRRLVQDFAAFSDTVIAGLVEPGMVVLADTIGSKDDRYVFWRGQEGSTPYAVYEDMAHHSDVWVHVRIAVPIVVENTDQWQSELTATTRAFLLSLRIDGTHLFDGILGFPVVAPFGK